MSSKMRTIIVLFRNDLRIADNEALMWATNNADLLLPLYCFDPQHFKGTYNFNFPKTGPHRSQFLLDSVADLQNQLRSRGSGLVVRSGTPASIVAELQQQLGNVTDVVYQKEVTSEELKVERDLQSLKNIQNHSFWGLTLYHKDDVPFPVKRVPDVYTEFRKLVENRSVVRKLAFLPDQLKPLPAGIEEGNIPSLNDLGISSQSPDSRTAFPFKGGETAAQERLNYYFWESDKVTSYKETRNGLLGADYSTKFSPWLAHGCVSARQIYWAIKEYESKRVANQSTYWVIFELLWRDYFKFVALKYGNKLFHLEGIMGRFKEWNSDKKLFQAWKEGRTGVPFVDANMRELAATGFMSNRGRQNVASFLTKDLKLDWRLGAEWFESQLVDHDVCSNYGNWLYSAGIGNDPRQDRKFNMIKQGLDYDAQGDYIRTWVPELAALTGGEVHMPWTVNASKLNNCQISLGETYPNPVVIAPEWNRHSAKTQGHGRGRYDGSRGRGRGQSSAGPAKQRRGIDFYFKSPK